MSKAVDVGRLVSRIKTSPDVGPVEVQPFPCSAGWLRQTANALSEAGVERVVVAGVSERLYGKLYRGILAYAGIHPSLVRFANFREHCVLLQRGGKRKTTERSARMIEVAAAQAAAAEPSQTVEAEIRPACAILGGGISGMSAARALAVRGIRTVLVEKEARLGGMLNRLNAVFPSYMPASDFLAGQVEQVRASGVEVLTGAEPVELEGRVGDYTLRLSTGDTVEVGAIVVASGAGLLAPEGLFGYGEIEEVVTQVELENMLLEGRSPGSNIVMIQCAGSRNEQRPYCSRICCTASIKNTVLIKELYPSSDITVLSRGFAEYAGDLDKAREMGVSIIRYQPERPPIVESDGVLVYDTIEDREVRIQFDRVVLAVPMVPSDSSKALAEMLRIPMDRHGFMTEPRLKVRPEDSAPRGIFVAGSGRWPSTITESMLEGYAAASRVFDLLTAGRLRREGFVSSVDPGLCRGCGRCEEACRHGAVTLSAGDDGIKVAEVASIQCTGCGVCTSVCPSGAIALGDMAAREIEAAVRAAGGDRY
jgi:heterodisulfide reductase subunit A